MTPGTGVVVGPGINNIGVVGGDVVTPAALYTLLIVLTNSSVASFVIVFVSNLRNWLCASRDSVSPTRGAIGKYGGGVGGPGDIDTLGVVVTFGDVNHGNTSGVVLAVGNGLYTTGVVI